MEIGRIRDTMDFSREIFAEAAPGELFILRVYVTRRSGAYGHQFAAVAWYKSAAVASGKTAGCGYDKVNECTAGVFAGLAKAGVIPAEIPPEEGDRPARMSVFNYCRSWGPEMTLRRLFPGRLVHVAQG